MRFTVQSIAKLKLPAGKAELIAFDEALPGFGIRIRSGGKQVWIVQYRVGKKQRRLTLSSVAAMNLDLARAEAKKALSKVGLAIDPQAEKSRRRADAAITLESILDRYLPIKETQLRRRSYEETERQLRRDWSPLHGLPVTEIGRTEIANRLGVLAREAGPVAADRARAALSAFFSWAMREGLVQANPVVGTNRPVTPVSRDRILTDDELREIWNATREDDFGRIVRLLMLTGQRREEVSAMAWSEVDFSNAMWSLPGDRTKNHRPHEVPLSEPALAVIRSVPSREDRDLLFGEGDGSFSGWSKAKAALDKRILAARMSVAGGKAAAKASKAQPMPAWRLHDLRRTAATRIADLGIAPHVIEAVLNHISGSKAGVAGIYNRAIYSAEKRAALAILGDHITSRVTDAAPKLVPIRRA